MEFRGIALERETGCTSAKGFCVPQRRQRHGALKMRALKFDGAANCARVIGARVREGVQPLREKQPCARVRECRRSATSMNLSSQSPQSQARVVHLITNCARGQKRHDLVCRLPRHFMQDVVLLERLLRLNWKYWYESYETT